LKKTLKIIQTSVFKNWWTELQVKRN
jgi:hypothetical protein